MCWCYVKEVMENIKKRNLRCGSIEKFPHELFDFLRNPQSKYHSLTEMTAANVIAIVDLHLLFLFEITLNSFASLSIFTKCSTLYNLAIWVKIEGGCRCYKSRVARAISFKGKLLSSQ